MLLLLLQILFFKIREEQVRKWKLREKELEEKSKLNPIKHSPRKVGLITEL